MTDGLVRLHISPFAPDLLHSILPSFSAGLAKNVSYHSLQTFPENNYGYVELPRMEGDKLKKKLNGSILKSKKIHVEEARPCKGRHDIVEASEAEQALLVKKKKSRIEKRGDREHDTIQGYEISPDRKVKRGWTEPKKNKAGKSRMSVSEATSSRYTEKEELLFRAKVPPNKVELGKEERKTKSKRSREVIVHEFEKSTMQPTFLRAHDGSSKAPKATQYVDGRGWVDENGVVIEHEDRRITEKKRRLSFDAKHKPRESKVVRLQSPQSEATSTSGANSSQEEDFNTSKAQTQPSAAADIPKQPFPIPHEAEETSSEGYTSGSALRLASRASSSTPEQSEATSVEETRTPRAGTPVIATTKAVHPLETLFKRPVNTAIKDIAKPTLEVQTSFNFFEPDEETTVMPDTPFNSQDLRSRGIRSAAPTPDTAAPARSSTLRFGRSSSLSDESCDNNEEIENIREGKAAPHAEVTQDERHQQSDFAKWFWENRGENNRAWKRRRREVMKEERQREIRQRGRRVG